MMRPNDFIKNTDYLALAQTGCSNEFVANFPAKAYPSQNYEFWDADDWQDFNFQSVRGAIDQFRLKVGDNEWYVGNTVEKPSPFNQSTLMMENGGYAILVYRISANTIRVRCIRYAPEGSFPSVPYAPAILVKVRGIAFRPPNIF